MKQLIPVILILALLFQCSQLTAQLYQVPLEQKVSNSSLIIEGKVTGKTSFWNSTHSMIFTSNTIEIYKVFKGNTTSSTIEVMTQGGNVGNDYIEASDLLTFDTGDVGILFCYPNDIGLKSQRVAQLLYDVYSSRQGFLKYNLSTNQAETPFESYPDIEGKLYKLIQQHTGSNFRVLNSSFRAIAPEKKAIGERPDATAVITSFSPTMVNAGALNNPATNLLTINGAGFGAPATGKQVVFKDANNLNLTTDYAIESTSPYITSWTDKQIVVKVPTRAGTGRFGIVSAAADTAYAPAPLQIFFAVLSASFNSGAIISEPRLMNANGQGGYTISYSTSTAGGGTDITKDSAYDDFRRALKTWKEVVGVNFIEGDNTTVQLVDANDNINTIMFDNTNTGVGRLPSGTLAVTYSNSTICNNSNSSQKTGFDMVIRKEGVSTAPVPFPFNKTVCGLSLNRVDLEGTVLHELGHALNLAHIYEPQEQTSNYTNRNPAKLMHPNLTLTIARKALDESSYAGALYTVTPQKNTDYGTCRFPGEMVPTAAVVSPFNECPDAFPTSATITGTTAAIDLFHASSNKFKDPQYTSIGTVGASAGAGVSVTNNAYYVVRTNTAGQLTYAITNYSTAPAEAQAGCAEQAARIAVYQVNSCPGGQAFPAPMYVSIFNANTSATIQGLTANSNYLFYFDGVYSTKPVFSITFTGNSILPNVLTDFYGQANKTLNSLFVQLTATPPGLQIAVERSLDSLTFQSIGTVNLQQPIAANKYSFNDVNPLSGNNYYRIKIINADGSFVYSKVVLLINNLSGTVVIYPNPVTNQLSVNLSYLPAGEYNIRMIDAAGRILYTQTSSTTLTKIAFSRFARGVYFLQVIDSKNNVVTTKEILSMK